ncbi:MAG: hypothetical protein ABH879_08165 [archaeon]
MSGNCRQYVVIFVVLLSASGFSLSDFQLFSENAELRSCACVPVIEDLIIINTGDTPDSYSFTGGGDASGFANYIPAVLVLAPGDSATVKNYLTVPCSARGNYSLDTIITSGSGLRSQFRQNVIADACVNFELRTGTNSLRNYPCLPTTFSFNLKNIGAHVETYRIGVEPGSNVILSMDVVALGLGQDTDIAVLVAYPCEVFGDLNFSLRVTAENTRIMGEMPFYLTIDPSYNYSVSTGAPVSYPNDLNLTEIALEDWEETHAYYLCEQEPSVLPIRINNSGYVPNTFVPELEGEPWAETGGPVSLWGFHAGVIDIVAEPPAGSAGAYDFDLLVRSVRGNITHEIGLDVNVTECYSLALDLPAADATCCDPRSYDVTLSNRGSYTETVNLSLIGPEWASIADSATVEAGRNKTLALVAAPACTDAGVYPITVTATLDRDIPLRLTETLALAVHSKEQCYGLSVRDTSMLPDSSIRVPYGRTETPIRLRNPGQKPSNFSITLIAPEWATIGTASAELLDAYLNLTTDPGPDVEPGTYDAVFIAETSGYSVNSTLRINLRHRGWYEGATDYLSSHRWYFFGGLAAALLLIILAVFLRTRPGKLKRESRVRFAPRYGIVIPLVILLIILAGSLVYFMQPGKPGNETILLSLGTLYNISLDYFAANETVGLNGTQGNEAGVLAGYDDFFARWREAEENVTQSNHTESFTYQVWDENSEKQVNLGERFYDPDNGSLYYRSTAPANIRVYINGSTALLTPKRNWHGADSIVFTATDDKNSSVSSPNITLVVRPVDKPFYRDIMDYAGEYIPYVILGFALLGLLIAISIALEGRKD